MYKIRFTPAKIQLFIAQIIDIYIYFSMLPKITKNQKTDIDPLASFSDHSADYAGAFSAENNLMHEKPLVVIK